MRRPDPEPAAADHAGKRRRFGDRAYLAWTTLAVAYAIAFLQRVSPQSISQDFMRDFGTDAAGIAMLASSYFWGYTLMQIPAGLLVDRYGVQRVALVSMAASSLGSAGFALAPNLLDIFAARLVIACGDALVFTALLKLVAQNFSDERFGTMSGVSQVSGYIGGVMAATPLAAAAGGFGWRPCFLFIACIGLVNLAMAKLVLKPDWGAASAKTLKSVAVAALHALSERANWGCAMTFASHFAVVTTLSGVWGIPMLAHVFQISPAAAGLPLLAFMAGNAVGSLFLGHAADRTRMLGSALIRICVLRMILIGLLLPPIAHALGLVYVGIIFTALGLVSGGTVPLILKCTKRLYTADLIGVGASVNTTSAGIYAAATQPLIGLAMLGVSQSAGTGAAVIGDSGYDMLIAVLLLMSLPGIAGPLLMGDKLTVGTPR